MSSPTAKSLTLDLLSSVRGESMPIAALVAAAALFGIAENSLRVAVARLLAAGRLERAGRGRYRIGPAALAVDRHARSWRTAEARRGRWSGRWIAAEAPATGREPAVDRALAWLGFERFRSGLALRPDNWKGGTDAVRAELRALGIPPSTWIFRLDDLDDANASAAAALWDPARILAGYRESLATLEASRAALDHDSEERAMVTSFMLGGEVIRQLARDPLLPEEWVPAAPRMALVASMREYDRVGRRAWAAFMARHGAPHLQHPSHGASEMLASA